MQLGQFVCDFFKGNVQSHVVGSLGRGPRPGVLIAAAALAVAAMSTSTEAHAQKAGWFPGPAQPVNTQVQIYVPTQKLGGERTIIVAGTVTCEESGGGVAVTVIGNTVVCGRGAENIGQGYQSEYEPESSSQNAAGARALILEAQRFANHRR